MEKKKLLLVAVSVGVVLLVMIGVPLLLVSPGRPAQPEWQSASQNGAGAAWAAEQPPAQPPAYVVQDAQPAPAEPEGESEEPRVTTFTVTPPRTAAVPDAQAAPPAAQPRQPAAAQPPAAPAQAAQAAPERPAASAQGRSSFWIQVGSFSSSVRAESVRESLEAKGIASVIENRNIGGDTRYRVRVGPYLSETEARYWLALVSSIDGFGDSMVFVSQAN
jgi:DedD protein